MYENIEFYEFCEELIFSSRLIQQLKLNITRAIEEVNETTLRKVARNMAKRVGKCIEMNGHYFQH